MYRILDGIILIFVHSTMKLMFHLNCSELLSAVVRISSQYILILMNLKENEKLL